MKYKAYQVSPEYQESPLNIDELVNMGELIVYGNRDYKAHTTPDFDNIIDGLTVGEFDSSGFPEDFSEQKKHDINFLAGIFLDSLNPQKIIALALSVWTGDKWDYKCIRGCSQSEWNYIYYMPDMWTDKALRYFEIEYYNTGEEWRVVDEDGEEYYYYTHEWSDCEKTRELAEMVGCSVQNLTLYAFDGWDRTPKYKEVN